MEESSDDAQPPKEHEVADDDDGHLRTSIEASTTSTTIAGDEEEQGHGEDEGEEEEEEESTAPIDFQVVSSDSEDEEKFDQLPMSPDHNNTAAALLLAEKIPCPLCKRRRQRLTCKECLTRGDFCVQNKNSRNSSQTKDRYSELKSKLEITQRTLSSLKERCSFYTNRKEHIGKLADEIEKCQSTIAIQHKLKVTLHAKIRNVNKENEVLQTRIDEKLKMWPIFRKRLDNMQSQYVHNCTKLKRFHEEVQKRQDTLKRGTRSRIIQLRQHVFPIEEFSEGSRPREVKGMFGSQTESWSDEDDETVRSLMVAQSNYWSKPDDLVSSFGICHTITGPNGPTLPSSGDYSAYNMWADRSQTAGPSSTTRNPAHCIAAALTYTTQFVNLIAYYVDLRLPHRLSYSEFANGNLSNGKFSRKVAKLNANVIHLCSSQGIHATSLQPRKTISNILLMFDPEQSDLGRRGPFEVALQLAKSMEDSLEKDLVICSEEGPPDSDSEWSVPSDWETINRAAVYEEFGLHEMKATELLASPNISFMMMADSNSISRSQSANSLGGGGGGGTGLLSSFTSLFRGWNK